MRPSSISFCDHRIRLTCSDGHHAWSNCYQSLFLSQHAIPIVAVQGDSDVANIYLPPDLPIYAEGQGSSIVQLYNQLGLNTPYLAGAQVRSIEGQDVWEYLEKVAVPSAGVYQDAAQRLNSLFVSMTADGTSGTIGKTPGRFTLTSFLPDKDNITLSVTTRDGNETDIVVPWVTGISTDIPFTWNSGAELFQEVCSDPRIPVPAPGSSNQVAGGESQSAPTSESPVPVMESLEQIVREAYQYCPVRQDGARYAYPMEDQPLMAPAYLGGRDIQFYQLNDTQTGVIFIPTFAASGPANSGSYCEIRFLIDAYLGIRNLTQAGVTRVLIDTSNNGGGAISATQWLQRLMTGEQYLRELNFETLLVKAPLAEAIVDAHIANPKIDFGSYSPQIFRNGSLMDLANSTDYFDPGMEKLINGKTLRTSNFISDSVEQIIAIDQYVNLSDTAPFAFDNIVFVGNGLCGSACASFTNFMIEYANSTAYIQTPRPQENIEFQAFAAGQVTNSDSLYLEAAVVGVDDRSLLPLLEYRGRLSYALRGAVSPILSPGEFIQYRAYPAQKRYTQTMEQYTSPLANWNYIASQVFGA